jgi:hypothetical protein
MIYTHEHYEMLTALATAGQLSDSELRDLRQHTRECVACLQAMAEMEEVSRELFLTQVRSTSRSSLPAGMQQRFQERARSAGIPLSSHAALPLNSGFLRMALVTLLVTVCATLSWKLLVAPPVQERASVEADNSAQKISALQPNHELPVISGHLLLAVPQKHQQVKRKALSQREPDTAISPKSGSGTSQTSFVLSRPSFLKHDYAGTFSDNTSMLPVTVNQDYMTSGLHLPGRKSFELVSVPNIWGAVDRERSDQRTFHYNPNFASLSFLDGPQGSGITTIPTLNISRSQFHLDINKTW